MAQSRGSADRWRHAEAWAGSRSRRGWIDDPRRHAVDGHGRLLHRLTLTPSGEWTVRERSGQERDRPEPREGGTEADRPRPASRQMERPAAGRAGEPRAGMSAHNPHDGFIVWGLLGQILAPRRLQTARTSSAASPDRTIGPDRGPGTCGHGRAQVDSSADAKTAADILPGRLGRARRPQLRPEGSDREPMAIQLDRARYDA